MKNWFDLSGRTALVTGSSRGIGRAIAQGLADAGAAVAVHGVRASSAAEALAAEMKRACAVYGDLASADAPARLLDEIEQKLGPVDILVLNASVQQRRPWAERDPAAFEQQVAVNLRSSIELMQRAVPGMCERGWGRVLTIGSVQQYRPHPQMLTYAATKAALENVARNVARQVAARGVTVNNLSPGVVLTDRNSEALDDPAYRQRVLDMIPTRTFGEPSDCVAAALLLCSDAGRYITGIDLPVDGGLRLP